MLILLAPITVDSWNCLIDDHDRQLFRRDVSGNRLAFKPFGEIIFKRDCDGHRESSNDPKSSCSDETDYVLNPMQQKSPNAYAFGLIELEAVGSDYFFSMAACAAANRAMGTRNGEQLT